MIIILHPVCAMYEFVLAWCGLGVCAAKVFKMLACLSKYTTETSSCRVTELVWAVEVTLKSKDWTLKTFWELSNVENLQLHKYCEFSYFDNMLREDWIMFRIEFIYHSVWPIFRGKVLHKEKGHISDYAQGSGCCHFSEALRHWWTKLNKTFHLLLRYLFLSFCDWKSHS